MKMIRAIIRPEKGSEVEKALRDNGFPALTIMDVYGRGRQMGIHIGNVFYDELPKQMFLIVVEDEDEEVVSKIIMEHAVTGDTGNFGDGRIFVTDVLKTYTVSTRSEDL